MTGEISRFVGGFVLLIKGGVFLLKRRHLLVLALTPLMLNLLLYVAAIVMLVYYYGEWFGLIMQRPEIWYMLIVYHLLRILAFLTVVAVFIFSFVFVGTVLAAPFLDLLSERVETALQDKIYNQPVGRPVGEPFRIRQLAADILRSVGHAAKNLAILIAAFPLNFVPVVGQASWLGVGWLLLAYDFTSFAMDRRRLSFREKWQRLLADLPSTLGFGAAVFLLLVVPLVGLVVLPVATVAGTMLFLDIEDRNP